MLKGHPKRLYVLDFGLFRVHSNGRTIGICGYLIQTDHGENLLVDSGFPAKYATDPKGAAEEDGLEAFGEVLKCSPGHLPEAQLALIGLSAKDIDLFLLTHTHIDHVGGIADFPETPLLLSKAERDLSRPLYWGQVQPMEWPDREYLTVDQDTRVAPGIQLLMAPGHTAGQIALQVDLPRTGPVLLTSDAISRPAEIDEGFDSAPDPLLAAKSASRLMDLAAAQDMMVIYGHCPQQWPQLRKAPAFYD